MNDLPPDRDLPSGRLEQRRAHLVRELRRPARRRRWAVLLVPVALLLGSGAVAATQLLGDEEVQDFLAVDCYARADLGARSVEVRTDPAGEPGARPGDRSAASLCGDAFRGGRLGRARTPPRLHACVRGGEIAVFPGTCTALALRRLPADWQRNARAATTMLTDIGTILQQCDSSAEATRAIAAELRERGFEKAPEVPEGVCGRLTRTEAINALLALPVESGGTSRAVPVPARMRPDRRHAPAPPGAQACFARYGRLADAPSGARCHLVREAGLCPTRETAVEVARGTLRRRGEHGWRTIIGPPPSEGKPHCYVSGTVDPEARTITLVATRLR